MVPRLVGLLVLTHQNWSRSAV